MTCSDISSDILYYYLLYESVQSIHIDQVFD